MNLVLDGSLPAIEGIENMSQLIGWNARPAIGHPNLDHRFFRLRRREDADPSALSSVFGGVADQIQQHALQSRGIAKDRRNAGLNPLLDRAARLFEDPGAS